MENKLLPAVANQLQRHRVPGDHEPQTLEGFVVPLKPVIQRFQRCETAMLPRLNATQLRIVLWTRTVTLTVIFVHGFKLIHELIPIRAVTATLFDPQN